MPQQRGSEGGGDVGLNALRWPQAKVLFWGYAAVSVRVCVCVCACVRACARARVCVCVCLFNETLGCMPYAVQLFLT